MSLYDAIDPVKALLYLPMRTQYVDGGGNTVTENLGGLGPATVQVGNGVTATSFPSPIQDQRGFRFDGASDYLVGPAVPNATYTFVSVVNVGRAAAAKYLYDCRAAGGTGYALLTGGVVSGPAAAKVSINGRVTTAFPSGEQIVLAVAGETFNAPSLMALGVQNLLGSSFFLGEMRAAALYPGTLTQLQIDELGRRMRQNVRVGA